MEVVAKRPGLRRRSPMHILVVEDDVRLAEALARILEEG